MAKNNKGVSIIEAMVAISIISVGVIGIVSLVLQSIQVQYINKNALIASQLAQEGMEIVRNVRDKNWLTTNQDYNQDIAQSGLTMNYAVDLSDAENTNFVTVSGIDDINTGLYVCDGLYRERSYVCASPVSTIFKRMITTSMDTTASSVDITCLIQWRDRTKTYQFTTRELLYNWTGL